MQSLAGLATRTLRRSARRYLLTAVGASLGVAVLFAILVTSAASRDALRAAVDGQTGRADVIVTPSGSFDSFLPPGTTDAVRALTGVEDVVATVGFRSAVTPAGIDDDITDPASIRERTILITGVGTDYALVNELVLVDGREPSPGASEVLAPQRLADSIDAATGDVIEVATPAGPTPVTIVGLLADRGAATSNQGHILFTSEELARGLLGTTDGITALQVVLAAEVDTPTWIDTNRDRLAGVAVQDAADVAAGFAEFIEGVTGALTLVAAVAVFIGGFLVYLTFSIAVTERTKVLGTLRALGATAARVQRLVVFEAILLGALCALVGLALGAALAGVAVGVVGGLLGLDLGGVGVPVGLAALSSGVGVAVAALAALVPARRAARIDPVSAMRGGSLAIERAPRRWLGPGLLALGAAFSLTSASLPVTSVAMLVTLTGAVLTVHLAIGPVASVVGRVTARLAPGTGEIAVRHLQREGTRSSFTLALVMVALAVSLAVAATNVSMQANLDRILDRQASAIQVGARGAVDDGAAAELAGVPGVGTISPVRFGTVDVSAAGEGGRRAVNTFLQVIDPATYFEVSSFPYVEGDDATVQAALAAGGAVVLPAREANRFGVGVGDTVELGTRAGREPFDVVGVYDVLGGGFGAVLGEVDLARVGAGRVNGFLVGTDGADIEAVADAIQATLAGPRQLVVDSPADTRAFAEAQVAGFFGIAYAILVVALGISLLGLANTLVVTVLDRTREIGVLRSTGARRRQVRRMVTVEATTMAVIALVLAVPLAAVLAVGITDAQRAAVAEGLAYTFPWAFVAPLGLFTVVVAALASVLPARRAGRLEIVEALRFE